MKLLGRANSINVRKVLWTCSELDLNPEREDWGSDELPTRSDDFLAINPKALVPVWIDGDFVLTESNAICRYLVTSHGRTDLFPEDPKARALVDSWMDWAATELNTAWRTVFLGRVRQHPAFADEAAQEASARAWNKAMTLLESHLATSGDFVCGDTFTLADLILALTTNRWEMTPMERPALPAIAAWMERMADRPGFEAHCRNGVP